MLDRLLADSIVLLHLLFIAFAVGGGIIVLRWRRVMWVHLPAVAWAVWVEVMNRPCPLTPLENYFRRRGGEAGYSGGFVEHYIWPMIYPAALTDRIQLMIGAFVFCVNVAAYALVAWRWKRLRSATASSEASFNPPAVAR